MADDKEKTNFWITLPGILTGIAAVITAMTAFLTLFGNNPFIGCKGGESCYQEGLKDKGNGKWDNSIKDFNRAINIFNYKEAKVYYNRGLAYKGKNPPEWDNAIDDLEKAIKLNYQPAEDASRNLEQARQGKN